MLPTDFNNLSLNEILKQKRLLLDLSLQEVAQKTGIKPAFLKSLEQGHYHELPAEVYVQGYLKSLSRLYGFELSDILERYKEERGLLKYQDELRKLHPPASVKSGPVLTPKAISVAAMLILFMAVSLYMGWQISQVTASPELLINSPQDGQVVQSNQITVFGRTEPGVSLTINNQVVPVDEKGYFEQNVYLQLGENQIVIRAANRFDKSSEIIRRVVFGPANSQVLGESKESTTTEPPENSLTD